MNQRELNKQALQRLMGRTLLKIKLAQTPTSNIYHIKSDEIETCQHQETTLKVFQEIDLWLEKNRRHSRLVVYITKDGTPMQMRICWHCSAQVRYYANRTLREQR